MNKKLYIICDAKSGTYERMAQFKTFFFICEEEDSFVFNKVLTSLPGMEQFSKNYRAKKLVLIGRGGIGVDEFLEKDFEQIEELFQYN